MALPILQPLNNSCVCLASLSTRKENISKHQRKYLIFNNILNTYRYGIAWLMMYFVLQLNASCIYCLFWFICSDGSIIKMLWAIKQSAFRWHSGAISNGDALLDGIIGQLIVYFYFKEDRQLNVFKNIYDMPFVFQSIHFNESLCTLVNH